MTNKQRITMIEQWVTQINPNAILRAADARCGATYAVQLFLLQESSHKMHGLPTIGTAGAVPFRCVLCQ